MPWKNGGGTTTEIAVSPAGAGLDDFDWRVSMARVESGGPFSLFAGVDRSLAIIDGDGINLTIGGAIPVGLDERSQPLPFAADVETHATLVGGPVTDLNVMTRRGKASHHMRRFDISETAEIPVADGAVIVICDRGDIIVSREKALKLGPRDTFFASGEAGTLRLEPTLPTTVLLIEIATRTRAD
jgi:environmental stress-induced protein Ves